MLMKIKVNDQRCKQCGLCIAFCPFQVFEAQADGSPEIKNEEKCVACMQCVRRCPDFAIEIVGGKQDA